MGDRFYAQQKDHKPKRRLKADVIAELQGYFIVEVSGLDRLTIKSLEELIQAVAYKQTTGNY